MQQETNYGNLAYSKAEELEASLGTIKQKVKQLEILYGTTPPPPDPNDTEDEPYIPPQPGEIITTGDIATVPVYYTNTTITTFPNFYFTAHANSTIIIKVDIEISVLENPCTALIELFVDNEFIDSYTLSNPVVATYSVPFANSYVSNTVGHKINYKITPSSSNMTYKVVTAKYEILGNNIDFLNAPRKYSVYYNDGIYYLSKCEGGYSNHLIQSISGLNLNADYTQNQSNAIEQKFVHATQRIDNVWQSTNLGYLYKTGAGSGYIVNFNDPTKKISMSTCYSGDFIPNLNSYYGGVIIFVGASGALSYYDVTVDFSSRATRTIEYGIDFYVNASGVKMLHDNFNDYPQKAKCVATRINGTNVFFSAVSNYYKVELGYGTNVHAFYSSVDCTVIDVFMKVYNQIVKKVLTLNTSTNKYELTSETVIGTWSEYILGAPPTYFTVANNLLSFNTQ